MRADADSIGRFNETDLHEQLKYRYAGSSGDVEAEIDGFIVDVKTDGEIVEIQTRGLGKLRKKLLALSRERAVRVVHPIAIETTITKLSRNGELMSSRRSPKRGRMEDAFREITSIADLLPNPRITIEILLVKAIETRIDDGKGSWRRKGVSIAARQLADVTGCIRFRTRRDYRRVLPPALPAEFTNQDLMEALSVRYAQAQPITSALAKMGVIKPMGKKGRQTIYVVRSSSRKRDEVH